MQNIYWVGMKHINEIKVVIFVKVIDNGNKMPLCEIVLMPNKDMSFEELRKYNIKLEFYSKKKNEFSKNIFSGEQFINELNKLKSFGFDFDHELFNSEWLRRIADKV